MRRFAYSGIRREDCEVMSCSSPLGESSVYVSRLISVGFLHCWSGSPGGSVLGGGLPLQWRVLECLIWPLFPDVTMYFLLCLWVQPGDQTLEADLGGLVTASILSRPPWLVECFRIC